jgi:hypothetical protein
LDGDESERDAAREVGADGAAHAAHDWTATSLSAMPRAKWGLMGLLMARLHPAPFGLRLALT